MRIAQIFKQNNDYYRIHMNLASRYGRATHCSNVDCTYKNPKRYEWALIKGKEYSEDINDYIQLCPSCHRKYDYKPESAIKGALKQKGKTAEYLKRLVMRLSEDDHYTYLDISRAAKENGISRTAIANCLSGASKSAGGYKWRYRV